LKGDGEIWLGGGLISMRDRPAAPGRSSLRNILSKGTRTPIIPAMTKLLEEAIEAVRQLPAESQDEIARTILHLAAGDAEVEPVDPAHLAAVLEGLAQAKQREFVTDAEVEAAFRRFDR
jgi:hypothetical protein